MRGLGRIQGGGIVAGGTLSWAPVVTQSGNPTYTSRSAFWTRDAGCRWIQGSAVIIIAGTGGCVANNPISITEPVNHASWYVGGVGGSFVVGTATIYDSSAGLIYPGHVVTGVAGSLYILPSHNTTGALMGYTASSSMAAALAAGDAIAMTFAYEAAA